MNETITLGDFIKEASVYKHSKEYFDSIKECGELTLMGMYLDSYNYMQESVEYGETVPDSVLMMFTEASEDKALAVPETKAIANVDKVKEGFFKKLWSAIVKFFKRIMRPFRVIAAFLKRKYDEYVGKIGKAWVAAFEKEELSNPDPERDKKIAEIISKIEKDDPDIYKIIRKGRFSEPSGISEGELATINKAFSIADKPTAKFVKNLNTFFFSADTIVPKYIHDIYQKTNEIHEIFKNVYSLIGLNGTKKIPNLVPMIDKLNDFAKMIGSFDDKSNVLMSRQEGIDFKEKVDSINEICGKILNAISSMEVSSEFFGDQQNNTGLAQTMKALTEFYGNFNKDTADAISYMQNNDGPMKKVIGYLNEIKSFYSVLPDIK